jgi:serine/threonine protein kinase
VAIALDEFVKTLHDSGIIPADGLAQLIAPQGAATDAEQLAEELIRQERLTRFQAQTLCAGKGKSLVLGNYVLLDKIGSGGMGEVFKARHQVMERLVAIKLLPAALTKDPAALERFHQEIKAGGKLNHPNIVDTYDADHEQGQYYLVVEYVPGSDLAALVKQQGPLPVARAVDFVLQAARGLECAHRRGVVHRDIKPANLLLDPEGTVKILDMGLARLELTEGEVGQPSDLTDTGAVIGTVDYMSPEQAYNSKDADERSDIYSLGCSLFFLLTGEPLYVGETAVEKILAHRDEPIPSLCERRSDVPEQLDAIFHKMVAKHSDDRYQSMSELVEALEACEADLPTSAALKFSPKAPEPAVTLAQPGSRLRRSFRRTSGLRRTGEQRPRGLASRLRSIGLIAAIGLGLILAIVVVPGLVLKNLGRRSTLIVQVNQPDAVVQVYAPDGAVEKIDRNLSASRTLTIAPGSHRLKVEKAGFEPFVQDFSMDSGRTLSVQVKLQPELPSR